MKLLLDTHAFIWWDSDPQRLSAAAKAALCDPENVVQLSVVSVWEIAIKVQLGKLSLRLPLGDIVAGQKANGLQILEVRLDHVLAVMQLPALHNDPFDRILVAQSQTENATLLTADDALRRYGVPVLW
jgi:PIN domain nuclease of toxin-antitoxin system